MKKINVKSLIIGVFIGVLISSGVVYAVTLIDSKDITYTPNDSNWKVSNVKSALDELYSLSGNLTFVTKSNVLYVTGTTPKTQTINLDPGKYIFIVAGRSSEWSPVFNITSLNENNTIIKIDQTISFSNYNVSSYADGRGTGILEIYQANIVEPSSITFSIACTNNYTVAGVMAIYK